MSLRLSHSHGANLKSRPETKIAAAGSRKATTSGNFSFHLILDFQRRQTQTANRQTARGMNTPKLSNQNWKIVGRPNSGLRMTQPGFHSTIDAAWKLSLINQTKNVAGSREPVTRSATCLPMRMSPKSSLHLVLCMTREHMAAIPLLRTKSTIRFSCLSNSRQKRETRTMLKARNVWTWKNGIEAYNDSSTQNGSGARPRSWMPFLQNLSRQLQSRSNPAGIA